jgi:ABC-2 type transport system ATP-binding protein
MPDTVIHVEHLRKAYGDLVAVDDVSFDVQRGEIFGIVGHNGSGKTTTLECLQGLRHADSGTLRVLDLDPWAHGQAVRRRIGSQLQESALPDRIKVWEALDLFASLADNPVDWRLLLDQWGLSAKRNATFANLSGGQRQRLFVALALVNAPEIVFLDEMTTGLDPVARREAWDLIRAIREGGGTVVLVTHFMEEAERLCDRVAVFRAGNVIAVDSPAALVRRAAPRVSLTFSLPGTEVDWLRSVPGVDDLTTQAGRVAIVGTGAVVVNVCAELAAHGHAPTDIAVDRPTLEDAYLVLTGAELEHA